MDFKRENLKGKNIVVYDLEIKTPIEKCKKGWRDYESMGISVGCAFDYRSLKYRVFMDDNINELADRLNEPGTLIVAFNHINFDNNLLRTHLDLKPNSELNNYDMLHISKAGCGLAPDARIGGFKLDDHLKACKLPTKTGEGALAPIWWQEKKIGKVVDYCLNDVTQERALFEYMYVYGKVASAHRPKFYEIERPNIGE